MTSLHHDMPTPPPLADGAMRIVALGGLGEVVAGAAGLLGRVQQEVADADERADHLGRVGNAPVRLGERQEGPPHGVPGRQGVGEQAAGIGDGAGLEPNLDLPFDGEGGVEGREALFANLEQVGEHAGADGERGAGVAVDVDAALLLDGLADDGVERAGKFSHHDLPKPGFQFSQMLDVLYRATNPEGLSGDGGAKV